MFRRIAVALDESPEAQRAFEAALRLAQQVGGELTVITVIEQLPAYMGYVAAAAPGVVELLKKERQQFYTDLQSKATQAAGQTGIQLRTRIIEGDEVQALVELIDEVRPDLLVLGLRHEPKGIGRFLGGTAHQLALQTRCNILGIR